MKPFSDLDPELQVQLFEKLEKHSETGVWFIDIPTGELYWSQKVYEIHELDPEKTNLNVEDAINYYHDDYKETISLAVEECIKNGTPWDLELKLLTSTQKEIWVHAVGSAIKNGEAIVKVYGTFKDITQIKRNEQELLQKVSDLERANKFMVSREKKMIELKEKIKNK